MPKGAKKKWDIWVNSKNVLSLWSPIPTITRAKKNVKKWIEYSVKRRICLCDPQMGVIFDKRIGTVEKVEHLKQSHFTCFLYLIVVHDMWMFWSYFPEQSKFDNCELTA